MSQLEVYGDRICVPGWGYPASFWQRVCGCEGEQWSWGYWEEPKIAPLKKGGLIVAHSFGLYLLPQEWIERANKIVWFGSFFSLPPFSEETLRACSRGASSVVKKFCKRMFFPHSVESFSGELREERLISHLEQLVQLDYALFWLRHRSLPRKIVCVQGARDRIIGPPVLPLCLRVGDFKQWISLREEGHMPGRDGEEWARFLKSCAIERES